MKAILLIAAILAMLCTCGFTIMMLVLCIAGSANSSDEQLRTIKFAAVGFGLLSLLGVGSGAWFLYAGRPGLATAVAILPAVVMMVTFVIKTL